MCTLIITTRNITEGGSVKSYCSQGGVLNRDQFVNSGL